MSDNEQTRKIDLNEVMLAMDVVDTLRHEERMIARELGAEDRERRLKERLRSIYESQGIEVSDEVLAQGVRALREERFVYAAPEPGFGRTLAVLYATRRRWGTWVGGAAALVAAVLVAYQLGVRGPELRAIEALPSELQVAHQRVVDVAAEPRATNEASALLAAGEAALQRGDHDAARDVISGLGDLHAQLERQYELRIVSRPGELSGVWRIPEVNPQAQNYYLIVEPIAPDGSRLALPVRNEEDGRIYNISQWGLRVDEETFQRVAEDKRDDGIIQEPVVGVKRRGELEPDYRVPTTGAAITDW
jgi:hypothetical protein